MALQKKKIFSIQIVPLVYANYCYFMPCLLGKFVSLNGLVVNNSV